jgi:hypothetical protein
MHWGGGGMRVAAAGTHWGGMGMRTMGWRGVGGWHGVRTAGFVRGPGFIHGRNVFFRHGHFVHNRFFHHRRFFVAGLGFGGYWDGGYGYDSCYQPVATPWGWTMQWVCGDNGYGGY